MGEYSASLPINFVPGQQTPNHIDAHRFLWVPPGGGGSGSGFRESHRSSLLKIIIVLRFFPFFAILSGLAAARCRARASPINIAFQKW
jgi:hypothetical protein